MSAFRQKTEPTKRPQPTRARGRPPDAAKRTAILHAARDLFFAGGLQSLNIEAVAREAAVSKVTVYRHFEGLPGLIRAVVLEERDRMTAVLDDLPADPQALRQGLIDFGVRLMRYVTSEEYLSLQRLLASQSSQHPWLGPLIYQEGAEATRSKLAALLARAVSRGDLRFQDCELAAEQLLGMWQGIQTTGLIIGGCTRPAEAVLHRRIEHAVDLLLRACISAEPSGTQLTALASVPAP